MEDSDGSLKDIYKSAIQAMEKEVRRLRTCQEFQLLTQKLEFRQKTLKDLQNRIKSLNSQEFRPISCSPNGSIRKFSSKSDNASFLEDKFLDLQEKLNSIKSRKNRQDEILENKMQGLSPGLYLTLTKLLQAKKVNSGLKVQLKSLAEERKRLNFTYSRITCALIKEQTFNERLENVEVFERKIKDKEMSIKVTKTMIEQFKANMEKPNPGVKSIFDQIQEVQIELQRLDDQKNELRMNLEKTSQEIEKKIRNPDNISIVDANSYCRAEIKKIQEELTEKSKIFKQLEHEKLLLMTRYAESAKKTAKPAPKKKSLSSVNTHSSLPTDRNSSRAFGSKTPADLSLRQSSYISNLLREKECTVTKDLLKVLEPFAPGESITAKIIAFNRSECNLSSLSSWSQMSHRTDRRSQMTERNQRSQLSFR